MKTSAAGRARIIEREGKRLVAYRDSVSVLTIGVGHTGRMSPPKVTPGMRITDAQCDAFLVTDLAPVEDTINAAVKVPMTQNEFDAMASLGFNIGVGGLRRSSVVRQLNLGDVGGAAEAFMAWSKPAVLRMRRRAEREQSLKADGPTMEAMTPAPIVVAKRAAVLEAKAEKTTASAAHDTKVAAGAAVVAGAVAAAQPAISQHHGVLWIAAIAFAVVALGAGLAAVLGRRKAVTLTANADAHKAALPTIEAGAADLAHALKQ